MKVTEKENYDLAKRFWAGDASEHLLWTLDCEKEVIDAAMKNTVYHTSNEFLLNELGCIIWGEWAAPYRCENAYVSVSAQNIGEETTIVYTTPKGRLQEIRRNGQIIKYKVTNEKELELLIDIWEHTEVREDISSYETVVRKAAGIWPVIPYLSECSVIQHLIQHETGVENLWYLLSDNEALVEQAMDVWQNLMEIKYKSIEKIQAIGCFQSENTSSNMISPALYEKYSLKHIQQFTRMAHRSQKKALVHMCGYLKALLPLLKRTEMDGIHSLSAPEIGDTAFENAFENMNHGFFALCRFGSNSWVNKSRQEIMDNLRREVKPEIYKNNAFILIVTGDGFKEIQPQHLYLLRDCINTYEKTMRF